MKLRDCLVHDWRVMYSVNVIILMLVIAAVTYLYFDSRPISQPEVVISRELLNSRIRARAGEELRVMVTVRRTADCPTYVHRWLINEQGVVLGNSITPSPFAGQTGDFLHGIIEVPVPDNLPYGTYKLHSDVVIDCGRKGTFTAPSFPDLPFEVIP